MLGLWCAGCACILALSPVSILALSPGNLVTVPGSCLVMMMLSYQEFEPRWNGDLFEPFLELKAVEQSRDVTKNKE